MPETVGKGAAVAVPEGVAFGTTTSSERHTPKPGRIFVLDSHLASTHRPARRTCPSPAHARQLPDPAPAQLEQLLSHVRHAEVVVSKYSFRLHVGRQRPLESTGRSGGQLEHWLNAPPEHDAQSPWQVMQLPAELNVSDGHELTHLPPEARRELAQVRQNEADPAQVLQDESHGWQVILSVGERKVPDGQLSTHLPLRRKEPGKHPVH